MGPAADSPYSFDGRLYQSLSSDARCVDLSSVDLVRERKLLLRAIGPGVVIGDTFFISGNGQVMRVGLDGTVGAAWEVPGMPTLRAGGVALAGGVLFASGGLLNAVDLTTGQCRWAFCPPLPSRREQACRRQTFGVLSTPVVAGEYVYVGGEDGYLYTLDAGTGANAVRRTFFYASMATVGWWTSMRCGQPTSRWWSKAGRR